MGRKSKAARKRAAEANTLRLKQASEKAAKAKAAKETKKVNPPPAVVKPKPTTPVVASTIASEQSQLKIQSLQVQDPAAAAAPKKTAPDVKKAKEEPGASDRTEEPAKQEQKTKPKKAHINIVASAKPNTSVATLGELYEATMARAEENHNKTEALADQFLDRFKHNSEQRKAIIKQIRKLACPVDRQRCLEKIALEVGSSAKHVQAAINLCKKMQYDHSSQFFINEIAKIHIETNPEAALIAIRLIESPIRKAFLIKRLILTVEDKSPRMASTQLALMPQGKIKDELNTYFTNLELGEDEKKIKQALKGLKRLTNVRLRERALFKLAHHHIKSPDTALLICSKMTYVRNQSTILNQVAKEMATVDLETARETANKIMLPHIYQQTMNDIRAIETAQKKLDEPL